MTSQPQKLKALLFRIKEEINCEMKIFGILLPCTFILTKISIANFWPHFPFKGKLQISKRCWHWKSLCCHRHL